MTDELGERMRKFVAEMRARHFGHVAAEPVRKPTDEELHAKYADANRQLREIYGTNEGEADHAD